MQEEKFYGVIPGPGPVSREEYRDAFREALWFLSDHELGRPPHGAMSELMQEVIKRDAAAQIHGE